MTNTSKPGPIHAIRFGNVRVTVWENRNAEGKVYHSLDLERSYRNKDGEWQSQNINLHANEIAKVTAALNQAYADLHLLSKFDTNGGSDLQDGVPF